MWPPPKPQDYQKDFKDLPSHIKIDRPPSQGPPGERGEHGETTRGEHSQERPHFSDDGRTRSERPNSGVDATVGHGNKEDAGAGEKRTCLASACSLHPSSY